LALPVTTLDGYPSEPVRTALAIRWTIRVGSAPLGLGALRCHHPPLGFSIVPGGRHRFPGRRARPASGIFVKSLDG